jgi:hypothetical protein
MQIDYMKPELFRKYRKNELNTCFQQKFTMGSYGVLIGRAYCSQKARGICSLLVEKKRLKKKYFSSYKLPKEQSTSFWSQEILWVTTLPNPHVYVHMKNHFTFTTLIITFNRQKKNYSKKL